MSIEELHAEAIAVRGDGDTTVLEGFELRARGGEIIGLRGPSASGKTTLLWALGGLSPLAGGSVRVDDRAVVAWRDLATGIVLQNLCLVPVLIRVSSSTS